ncbi:MAG: sodium:calcium antiporter [Isosphaeraceae bacterium]|jgi:cation:H+ antiporter|nr:MAG: sodium:calcium antiporter [Isosphaeraceae bacterium]
MLTTLFIFAASLAVLLTAARLFTSAAERVGLRLGMSPFAVGVFIVAIGTSLPELVASILSVRSGRSEIVSGNVLGANAANLMLILGLVSVAVPAGRIVLGEQYLFIDLNFLLGSTLALGTSMADGRISPIEGLALLAGYAVYIGYLIVEGRTASAERAHEEALPGATRSLLRDALILIAAGLVIYLSGERTVDALSELARELGVSPAVAAVTILSIGTTLPEMAVSVIAARRSHAALAVGNILGSCIFNAFAVSGAAAVVGGVVVPPRMLGFALPFVAAATLLFYVLTQDKRISRWEGLLFLVLFAIFLLEMAGVA